MDAYGAVRIINDLKHSLSSGNLEADAEIADKLEKLHDFIAVQHKEIIALESRITKYKISFKKAIEAALTAVEE